MQTFWNHTRIAALMRDAKIETEQEMNRRAGLSRLTMHNIARSGALTRLDLPTLDGMARALGLKGAEKWSLLTVIDDDPR